MRIFKFRIWSETDKCFYFLDNIFNMPDPQYEGDIEQFTGLLDRDGKEIYEGDVVQFTEDQYDALKGKERKAVIEWQSDVTGYKLAIVGEPYGYLTHHLGDTPALEIIGNIHDNPDMLQSG